MRREKARVETPTMEGSLSKLGVPAIPIKLVSGSDTGRPDDLFLIPHGRPLFIEFKWDDCPLEPKQVYWHGILRDLGYEVQVHNCAQCALLAIALKVVAAAIYAAGREVLAGARGSDLDARSWLAQDQHYTRSIQFLEEAGCSEQDACYRATQGGSSGLACRSCQVG